MKKAGIFLAPICLTMILNAQNGATIDYKITTNRGANGTIKINYSEWGNTSELYMTIPQMPGGGVVNKSLNMNSNPDVIYIINDKSKSYSEMKKTEAAATEDNKTYTVKKLGEEKVGNYKCVHAIVTEGKETHEVWNTKDIADFEKYSEAFKTNKRMNTDKREKALKDAGCDGIPVKFTHKGNANEGDVTMELVKLEKKNFSKSDFEIPAGYTKSGSASSGPPGIKSQQELMNMSPEERAKYIEEMKKMYGK